MPSQATYECRDESRYIKASIRRSVRQNAAFGCVACACPIIEYHHIVPFSEVRTHTVENIVALCPTCHKRADHRGQWSEALVRSFQQNPHNQDETKDRFIISTPDFLVKTGWIEFHNCTQLVALRDKVVLSCERSEEGVMRVTGKFQDPNGRLVAIVDDNEWRVLVKSVWDVEYIAARRLVVRTGPGNVVLRMEITDTELVIQQCFFRRGHLRFSLRGDDKYSDLMIEASGPSFFAHRNGKKMIFRGPFDGPALTLQ